MNLGGWFVLEPWITPKFFEDVNEGGDKVRNAPDDLLVMRTTYLPTLHLLSTYIFTYIH